MQEKTRGIVLGFIKYRETSIITRIYTEKFGTVSFIVNGVRSNQKPGKRNKTTIAFFQPLTLVDLVIYYKPERNINRISEVKCFYPYQTLPYQYTKSCIAFFLSEFLGKCLHEADSSEPLFNFLTHAFSFLDQQTDRFQDFHIHFLLHFSRYLGFHPGNGREINQQLETWFHENLLNENEVGIIDRFIASDLEELPRSDKQSRKHILEVLIDFYRLHIDNFGEIKSQKILQEILTS